MSEPILERAFAYWTNVDADLGKRIGATVREQADEKAHTTAPRPNDKGDEAEKV